MGLRASFAFKSDWIKVRGKEQLTSSILIPMTHNQISPMCHKTISSWTLSNPFDLINERNLHLQAKPNSNGNEIIIEIQIYFHRINSRQSKQQDNNIQVKFLIYPHRAYDNRPVVWEQVYATQCYVCCHDYFPWRQAILICLYVYSQTLSRENPLK